jgi:hypothetical protein
VAFWLVGFGCGVGWLGVGVRTRAKLGNCTSYNVRLDIEGREKEFKASIMRTLLR